MLQYCLVIVRIDGGVSGGPYKHYGWITKWNYGAFLICGRVNSTDATKISIRFVVSTITPTFFFLREFCDVLW